MTGKELYYIASAHFGNRLAGDGTFTKKCHHWLEKNTGTEKALLTHSCTAALEMAALLLDIMPGDEFKVGKKWTSQTIQTINKKIKTNRVDSFQVTAAENLTVPAGVFKTYKVENTATQDKGNIIKNTYWYQPGIGIPILRERIVKKNDGTVLFDERHELVSYSLGK